MSFINFAAREINCKIVYYGAGLGGKTTNLQFIFQKTAEQQKGKMISLATETDRTLFFDFLPLDLGTVRGFKTRIHLYTVPGQVFYDASRKLILRGVDGIVFVADSQEQRQDANVEALEQGRMGQAVTEGARAGRQLNDLREELRKSASNRFSEEMTEMRSEARHLDEDQKKLTEQLDAPIQRLAERFADKRHALFLGRGALYPIALEGALKLKEISYIHAEGYPAGELKHGPLALVDADMPVITVAPNNDLLEKLKSNLMEVRARGGELIVFADPESGISPSDGVTVIEMPRHVTYVQAPVVYAVPLQLLAYHVAILKGTDVDQPRNLAKSVTVE